MTSFGIEWETQAFIIHNPQYETNDGTRLWSETVINNSEEKWNIAAEIWENNAGSDDVDLCTHNLEVRIGEFYGPKTAFNTHAFTKACKNFMLFWNNVIDNKKITIGEIDHDIFTFIRNPSDKTGDIYYTTCKALKEKEGKNSFTDGNQQKVEWAYSQNLQLSGVPQITIGVNLKYVFHLFNLIYDKMQNPPTNPANIRAYSSLKNVSYAFIDTINDIYENDNVDVIIFILLCNNHIISSTVGKQYMKAGYLFKVRTNLGNMYSNMKSSSKKRIKEWKKNKLNSFITEQQKDCLKNIFFKYKGYVLKNVDQFKKVGLNSLTILPEYTLEKNDVFKNHLKNVYYSNVLHGEDFIGSVTYDQDGNSIVRWVVAMDMGEWEYTNDTVHIELRGVVPILQLLQQYDYKPSTNNIKESLCQDITFLLNTLSGQMKKDFPDKTQIIILKDKTKDEYNKYEKVKQSKLSSSNIVSFAEKPMFEYDSNSDSESDSELESELESKLNFESDSD